MGFSTGPSLGTSNYNPAEKVPIKSSGDYRFASFNVCGVRNVLKYYPWYEKKTFRVSYNTYNLIYHSIY